MQAGAVWYSTRAVCLLALPRSRVAGTEFVRQSGPFNLVIQTPPGVDLPYGIYPRGILNWITTEIVRNQHRKDRIIILGPSLAPFIQNVTGAKTQSGGSTGNLGTFKKQLMSLLSSRIMFWQEGKTCARFKQLTLVTEAEMFWEPKAIHSRAAGELLDPSAKSWLRISAEHWENVIEHGDKVAVDKRIIRWIWPDCLAYDLYNWATYKAYVLMRNGRQTTLHLTWEQLKEQFGPQIKDEYRFRTKTRKALAKVKFIYEGFTWEEDGDGLTFTFNRPSVLYRNALAMDSQGRLLEQQLNALHGN